MTSGDGPPDDARSPDRRPIAARNFRIAVGAALWLARLGVSPNSVSVVGMLFGVLAGLCLAATSALHGWERALWITAAACIQLRLCCNMLDGMVAHHLHANSPLGELYNEVPDRASDLCGLVGLGYAVQGNVALGYSAGALALFVAYVRAAARVAGAPQDYRGPMAKQQRMFIVTIVALFMGLAPSAATPAFLGNTGGLPAAALTIICIGCIITIARRLLRAASILKSQPDKLG